MYLRQSGCKATIFWCLLIFIRIYKVPKFKINKKTKNITNLLTIG